MCQATVFLDDTQIREEVVSIYPTRQGLVLKSLFNEQKTVQAEIREIDLLSHKVYLVRKNSD
jgi:predicted RNA-binding protein